MLETDVVKNLLEFVFVDRFASVSVILIEKWLDQFSDSVSKFVEFCPVIIMQRYGLL